MKVVFLVFLIFFIFVTPVLPFSFIQSSKGVIEIKENNSSFRFGINGISVKTPSFCFGTIEDGGIIALLDSPHSSYTLSPYFTLSSEDKTMGALFSLPYVNIFSFLGDRDGIGVEYKKGTLLLSLIYGSPAEDGDIQKERLRRRDGHTIWGTASYIWDGMLSFRVMSSFNNLSSFSLFFSSSLSFSVFTLSFSSGRIEAFSSGDKEWQNHYSLKINTASFSSEHSLYMGRDPIYLKEYRDYEFSFSGKLKIGELYLSSSLNKSFVDGREKRENRLTLGYSYYRVGYKDGLFLSFEKDGLSVEYSGGVLAVSYLMTLESDSITMKFSFSNKNTLNWTMKYEK